MKTTNALLFLPLLVLCPWMPTITSARQGASDLRYKFSVGQTNVYHIEVTVRSETGQETTTANVFLVPTEAGTNVTRLSCRATLEVKRATDRIPFGYFGGGFLGGRVALPDGCEVQLDNRGHVLRVTGDYPLPIPLGTIIRSLVEPLPESPSASRWELSDESTVMDHPFWLGPAAGFHGVHPFGPPFYLNYDPRQPMALLAVSRRVAYRVTALTPETVTIHKQLALDCLLKTGSEPRVSATGGGDLVFDRAAGLFKKIEMQCDTSSSTETASRHVKVGIQCRLLQGADLAAALGPPPPPTPPPSFKPTPDELQKLMADLTSADVGTRRAAAGRLRNAEFNAPPLVLLDLMASLSTDSDNVVRQSVAGFLGTYGTTNQIPALLKLHKDPDQSGRQVVIKALGRIKDERAIEPLTDDVARGSSFVQEASSALISIGSSAEKAVLQLLQERNLETRRQACRILQQIGTSESLQPLQNLVSDPDPSITQTAAEAIRAIKYRE